MSGFVTQALVEVYEHRQPDPLLSVANRITIYGAYCRWYRSFHGALLSIQAHPLAELWLLLENQGSSTGYRCLSVHESLRRLHTHTALAGQLGLCLGKLAPL